MKQYRERERERERVSVSSQTFRSAAHFPIAHRPPELTSLWKHAEATGPLASALNYTHIQ